jgi:enoyl-CoA hydratase
VNDGDGEFVQIRKEEGIATLTLRRGKVNALNAEAVEGLRRSFASVESEREVGAVVLTGAGKFFSFGFDIPELFSLPKEGFSAYLREFTALYRYLFLYPKPVVAALNGHAIAAGCMLALACDHRVMGEGNAKISLNEATFGSSLFAGSVEMLRFWVGGTTATEVAVSGAMFTAEEAKSRGLVHETVPADGLAAAARRAAAGLASRSPAAFASIKGLLRGPVADEMDRREPKSIEEFVEIWYSEETRANLKKITIGS